jgi:hypothetical protein
MTFALDTAQIIACVVVAAATAVLTQWAHRWGDRRRTPQKVTIRVIGTAVVAEPGDLLTIALNEVVSDEYYDHLVDQLQPLKDMGIKVGIVENASAVAVVRGRIDG